MIDNKIAVTSAVTATTGVLIWLLKVLSNRAIKDMDRRIVELETALGEVQSREYNNANRTEVALLSAEVKNQAKEFRQILRDELKAIEKDSKTELKSLSARIDLVLSSVLQNKE